jgi:hypothetical protein
MADDPADEQRRRLLAGLGKFALLAPAIWKGTVKVADLLGKELGPQVESVVHEEVKEYFPLSTEQKRLLQDLFLGNQENVCLVPASDNPGVELTELRLGAAPEDVFTLGTLRAAKTFGGLLCALGQKIATTKDLIGLGGHGNLVVFGSPTSNLV